MIRELFAVGLGGAAGSIVRIQERSFKSLYSSIRSIVYHIGAANGYACC